MSVENPALVSDRCLRPAQAAEKLAISLSGLWYRVKNDPYFPRPISLSSRTTVFLESHLDEYIAKRAAESQKVA